LWRGDIWVRVLSLHNKCGKGLNSDSVLLETIVFSRRLGISTWKVTFVVFCSMFASENGTVFVYTWALAAYVIQHGGRKLYCATSQWQNCG
jgi:hypothetical protein